MPGYDQLGQVKPG